MKSTQQYSLIFQILCICIIGYTCQRLKEKSVRPAAPINEASLKETGLDLKGCEFFKHFEKRFPCGDGYWMNKWGAKYCKKYADPVFFQSFTKEGRELLSYTNSCQRKFLEEQYRNTKPLRCKRFYEQAFEAQAKCYNDVLDKFCKVFPQNKDQFSKSMDREDYMNTYFISMVKRTLSKCSPPIDLFSLMFSG